MRKIQILFVGHGTCRNRGCEAIIQCSSALIHRFLPDSSIRVISDTVEYDSSIVQNWPTPVEFIPLLTRRTIYTALSSIKRRLGLSPGYPEGCYWQRNMYRYYCKSDIVVAVGGDNFTESYGVDSAVRHINYIKYAQYIGKATVVWAASIGPFSDDALRDLARTVFSQVDLITVRERWSLEYLRSLGISDNVRLVADPAFHLKPRKTQQTESLFIPPARITVGVGIGALGPKVLGISNDSHEQIFAQFIDHIIDAYDATVCLIPHVMYDGNDDLAACQAVIDRVRHKDRVTLGGAHNMQADELKQIIARCDYFIGFRTHSTIAALSSFVPTIAIAYSKKAWAIFEDVYGHTNYVVDGNSITVETLLNTFELLFSNRKSAVQTLQKRVPELKALSEKGATYLASIIWHH